MIQEVVAAELAVDEHLRILKNRWIPEQRTGKEKRFSLVTGIHGDELEGQLVCYELNRRIRENPEYLTGIVDIYPALNPLGIDSITRRIPMFELDMNRIFPGQAEGSTAEAVAAAIVEDLAGSDLCLDLHASNIFLQEIPQVRMSESTAEQLLPYARHLNADLIWIHASATVLESTLAHSLNLCGVPTLVVEMGAGMRVNRAYCEQILIGILNLLRILGIWQGPVPEEKEPQISLDRQVEILHAGTAGLFVPSVRHGVQVCRGEQIGDVVSPLTGEVQEQLCAGMDGLLFTLREYPMVYEGALVGRILGGGLG